MEKEMKKRKEVEGKERKGKWDPTQRMRWQQQLCHYVTWHPFPFLHRNTMVFFFFFLSGGRGLPCRSYISLRFHSTASPLLPPPINFSASSANRFRELFFLFLFSSFPPSFLPSKCTYVYASLEFFILIISLHLFILLFPLFFFSSSICSNNSHPPIPSLYDHNDYTKPTKGWPTYFKTFSHTKPEYEGNKQTNKQQKMETQRQNSGETKGMESK